MNVNSTTAFDILLAKHNALVKENILLMARIFELEDELKKQDGNKEETV